MSRSLPSHHRRVGVAILGSTLLLTAAASPTWAAGADVSPAIPGSAAGASCAATPGGSMQPTASPAPASSALPSEQPTAPPSPAGTSTPEPDTGGSLAGGDVPDNAVFLTYTDATLGFSIQYVEGWQVTPRPDGVLIRDKDSSETVTVVPLPADVAACVAESELPALQAIEGFSLIGQDLVRIKGQDLTHLTYRQPAPPDPVTDKRVPSTVDRYYVVGPTGMAIVSLSTPDGVDNVDAFRQMIESFQWH